MTDGGGETVAVVAMACKSHRETLPETEFALGSFLQAVAVPSRLKGVENETGRNGGEDSQGLG